MGHELFPHDAHERAGKRVERRVGNDSAQTESRRRGRHRRQRAWHREELEVTDAAQAVDPDLPDLRPVAELACANFVRAFRQAIEAEAAIDAAHRAALQRRDRDLDAVDRESAGVANDTRHRPRSRLGPDQDFGEPDWILGAGVGCACQDERDADDEASSET